MLLGNMDLVPYIERHSSVELYKFRLNQKRGVPMLSNREKGNFGEQAALNYLIRNGYIILDRNFRTKYGEIDIIAKDNSYIAFIEVKTRRNFIHGLPCESVNKNKQQRIARMALLYILKKKLQDCNFRFDVIEIVLNGLEVKYLRLIKDAFQIDTTI
jgi:putative endonuclease